jgi:hypothetical protein
MLIMGFGAAFHKSIGALMGHYWTGDMVGGVAVYSASTFQKGLIVIPVGLFVGAVGFVVVKNFSKTLRS